MAGQTWQADAYAFLRRLLDHGNLDRAEHRVIDGLLNAYAPDADPAQAAGEVISPTVRWWARDFAAAWVQQRQSQYAEMAPGAIRRSLNLGAQSALSWYTLLIAGTMQDAFDAEAKRLLPATADPH